LEKEVQGFFSTSNIYEVYIQLRSKFKEGTCSRKAQIKKCMRFQYGLNGFKPCFLMIEEIPNMLRNCNLKTSEIENYEGYIIDYSEFF
jgi:hypothetical protein